MCIQFAKSQGNYDFCSPLINMVGNGLVLAGVGAGSALIVAVALKALGYSSAAIAIGTALPLIAGTAGLAIAGAAAFTITATVVALLQAFGNR
jgi:hypothetical protein